MLWGGLIDDWDCTSSYYFYGYGSLNIKLYSFYKHFGVSIGLLTLSKLTSSVYYCFYALCKYLII